MALPFSLRPYQESAVRRDVEFARSAASGARLLEASPTGTGKSYVMLAVKDELGSDAAMVVPNASIMLGLLDKLQYPVDRITSLDQLYPLCNAAGIYTPVTYKNALLAGNITPHKTLLYDEAHHNNDTAETGADIELMTAANVIGYTATPYQGTPQGTYAYRKRWGEPNWIITIRDAIAQGAWVLPVCETWPLVNDDLIEVQNGQLVASQITAATSDKLEHCIELMKHGNIYGVASGKMLEPTIITCPDTAIATELGERMRLRGLAYNVITQATPLAARNRMMRDVYEGFALLQIRTVGEGTDIKARVMIDLAPTLSPVLWLQRFGRLTRPGGVSRYICTNLNYQRHCYLLEGVAPEVYLRDNIAAFGLSERTATRAFGLQSLGRLKATQIKTTSGIKVALYNVCTTEGINRIEYCVLVHPNVPNPVWFEKRSIVEDGGITWGPWNRCAPPEELAGFKSANPKPLSPGQRDWWEGKGKFDGRGAETYGIDPTQQVNAKMFSILPILAKYKIKL